VIRRGDIWWANIPPPKGSEPGHRRPVLIVQTDQFNESAIHTVIAAAFTSNLRRASAPGNVLCRKHETGLRADSVVNVSQLAALDKAWLTSRVSTLSPPLMAEVEQGLRRVLGL